jgi:drug/metabolite transporter (DMT)-like permease
VLTATLLALSAAVLHASWNMAIKQTKHDRYIALWAQFGLGGVFAAIAFVAVGGMAGRGWIWAVLSGCVQLPYIVLLARAYNHGDFSDVYPIARGGGAVLAAIGGLVLLGDPVRFWGIAAIMVVATGLITLAGKAKRAAVLTALGVAATIGTYTIIDSKGSRSTANVGYAFASGVMVAVCCSTYGIATGRVAELRAVLKVDWKRFAVAGFASLLTYTLVLIAVRHASVGYVSALRESSVVLAALLGWRFLGEGDVRRRVIASGIVLAGLIMLVTLGR